MATDFFFRLLSEKSSNFVKKENLYFETAIFFLIYDELFLIFKSTKTDYLKLIKSGYREENMVNLNLVQEMIKDILITKLYSITGIANDTHIPEDVLTDILIGINRNPTLELSRKIFKLHMTVRRDLYTTILKKILSNLKNWECLN